MDLAKASKYSVDRVLAILLLILTGPILLLVALGIRLESPGSPLALEERMGERGRPFTTCRFRTEREPQVVSRWGRFLRRTHLDGLPALLNVALGEMSFVGPRPVRRQEADACTPRASRRFLFRPGITGWAQVRGALTPAEEIELDLEYVERFSLWMDLRTLLPTLLGSRRAPAPPAPAPPSARAIASPGALNVAADDFMAQELAVPEPGATVAAAPAPMTPEPEENEDAASLLVIGASGRARVVIDAIEKQGRYIIAGLVDDKPERSTGHLMDYPLLGGLEALEHPGVPRRAVVTAGSPRAREAWFVHLENLGFELPAIVHPAALVGREVEIGAGTLLLGGAIVNSGTRLGRGVVVESAASIDHDCELADFVVVGSGANVAGGVHVGPRALIGIGASVMHGVEIGPDVLVGASAAVVDAIPAGAAAVGVPARIVRRTQDRPEPALSGPRRS
jgi:sugar O-acyltransferase (sialic acid O-acetyltransferase NeuD family)